MILLGHRTHLEAKAKGENRLSGQAGPHETVTLCVCQDPDGMVNAPLPERPCPFGNVHGADTTAAIRGSTLLTDASQSILSTSLPQTMTVSRRYGPVLTNATVARGKSAPGALAETPFCKTRHRIGR
jgi:hypothetical protein